MEKPSARRSIRLCRSTGARSKLARTERAGPGARRGAAGGVGREGTSEGDESPVDVSEDEVEGGEDRDDVRDEHAPQQPRQDRDVVEAGRADLAAERAEAALA